MYVTFIRCDTCISNNKHKKQSQNAWLAQLNLKWLLYSQYLHVLLKRQNVLSKMNYVPSTHLQVCHLGNLFYTVSDGSDRYIDR